MSNRNRGISAAIEPLRATPEELDACPLWRALGEFSFDAADSDFPLSQRLARDHQWPRAFARRVLEEYRRFLYLLVVAGHPCTPSEEVDLAWHLHLVYTRSYWDELCGELLGRRLHHHPTRGGEAEGAKFDDWYERTKESYARVFGEVPPADIWPPAAIRFGRDTRWVRVNRDDWRLVPRVSSRGWWTSLARRLAARGGRYSALLLIASAITLLAGCDPARFGETIGGPFSLHSGDFLVLVVALFILLAVVQRRWLAWKDEQSAGPTPALPSDSSRYEALAWLAGGDARAVAAVVHNLLGSEALEYKRARFRRWELHATEFAPPIGASPLEVSVQEAASDGMGVRDLLGDAGVRGALGELRTALRDMGWVRPVPHLLAARLAACAAWGMFLGLLGARIAQGVARERPVGFVGMLALVALVIATMTLLRAFAMHLHPGVERALGRLRGRAALEPAPDAESEPAHPGFALALFGVAALESGDPLVGSLLKRSIQGGGADAGVYAASCGGDSGGCGGGGCGGCGGS